ncbi:hypothetical protein F511_41811 [Dorcoceras hygrometricum]|uniref:Uncharacterized protein n=1 Tax=Dorcoceras hygrometricum TaxID=472368 RepID=A0A2Z7C329_9LAMI|nr:hypothetical protein F511_41811 [Dorcoceras hygrometricum]
MVASFFVNALQVDFESVLVMEHTGMAHMSKTLEDTGLQGFWLHRVHFIANRKLALTKETFAEAFGLPTEGMKSFQDIPSQTMVEIRGRFSGSDVPFMAQSKKKEMKIEFRLLHDIVAKELCAKAGSFDMVTSEKFDLMIAITARLKVNWAQVLFQVLVAMVNNYNRQSQGFAVQLSVVLERVTPTPMGSRFE